MMEAGPLMVLLLSLLLLIHSPVLNASTDSLVHPCQVETYTETINVGDCLPVPVQIETARCRGQCYSEDLLLYDWQSEPDNYRHQHRVHCCSASDTVDYETPILCQDNRQETIRYRSVTKCECKRCSDKCVE